MSTSRRAEVLATLRTHWPELAALGVAHLDVVGSVARDAATATSDVDLIADFSEPIDFVRLFDLIDRLEALLGAHVDLMSRESLKPHWRAHFAAEAVKVA